MTVNWLSLSCGSHLELLKTLADTFSPFYRWKNRSINRERNQHNMKIIVSCSLSIHGNVYFTYSKSKHETPLTFTIRFTLFLIFLCGSSCHTVSVCRFSFLTHLNSTICIHNPDDPSTTLTSTGFLLRMKKFSALIIMKRMNLWQRIFSISSACRRTVF